ncbi:uncharacterized protein LOC128667958 isoform X2 [Microplitis demolitor]|uniref:uncharacterized protein LOC128667958 isoform X2 n=1 Tax=Microplitis demolitor TaxID=69319 RepID=UPI00235B6A8F|nr:uncharacterized protein LOC128667958 isoform X2 [Microplitis demolitor]
MPRLIIIIYFININFIIMGQSAPLINPPTSTLTSDFKWRENTLMPVWLPVVPNRNNNYPINDFNFLKINQNEWGKGLIKKFLPEIESAFIPRQITSRSVKRDSILSPSWGAGGLPFSVLYMNSHNSRVQPTTENTSISRVNKNRINGRNSSGQRRQYSIIPQLFISYGWSSFGK